MVLGCKLIQYERDFQILAIDSSYGIKITFSFLFSYLVLKIFCYKTPQLRNIETKETWPSGEKEAKNEKCYRSNSSPGRVGGVGPRGKAKGQSSQQLGDLSRLKVQMSMDFNHFEVVIFF